MQKLPKRDTTGNLSRRKARVRRMRPHIHTTDKGDAQNQDGTMQVPENPTVKFYLNETEWSREGEGGTALTPTQTYEACEHIHEFITAIQELTGTR